MFSGDHSHTNQVAHPTDVIKMPNETWAMAYKFIYFVMMLLTFRSRSIGTYFLSDELDTNLPEQLGDRVDENWQDKRSVENDYSDGINRASSDYRDGNAETVVDGTPESEIFRRESESERNVDEVSEFTVLN